MKNNIILIGFMGVGKGRIARALCNYSSYFAIDTDDLIESLENKKIKNIFEENGEKYFRELEKKCALWCEKNVKNTIISTGGGFYKQENLSKIGIIVYLESSFEDIIRKMQSSPNSINKFKKRPLLNNLIEAKNIYNQRIVEYERTANITINIQKQNIDEIVNTILGIINENN